MPGSDGQKMSKSYGNTIEIFGEEKALRKKVMSLVMDSRTAAGTQTRRGKKHRHSTAPPRRAGGRGRGIRRPIARAAAWATAI